MKISPAEVGHFKNVDRARDYKRMTEMQKNIEGLARDVHDLDQDKVDLNGSKGQVVLDGARIPGQRKGEAGKFETRVSGEATFSPRGLEKLKMSGANGEQWEFHKSHGFLGLGAERNVYTVTRGSSFDPMTTIVDKTIVNQETGDMSRKFHVYMPPG